MAWTDKPTQNQLDAIAYWFKWILYSKETAQATKWLGEHANRREVSTEMQRLRELYQTKRLDNINCYEAPIWDGFEMKGRRVRKTAAEMLQGLKKGDYKFYKEVEK